MTVSELIDLLSDCDPDAEVLFATQPSWPFEHDIRGLVCRRDVTGADDVSDGAADFATGEVGGNPSDILLVEGSQLRYASKACWDLV